MISPLFVNDIFPRADTLRVHLKTVHGNARPHICEICNHKFKLERHLKRHKSLHSVSEDINCNLCAKTFSQNEYLTSHMRYVHGLSEKPFKCEHCEKSFFYKSTLAKHTDRMHDKPKSYKCNYCQKEVRSVQTLKNHIYSFHHKRFHLVFVTNIST